MNADPDPQHYLLSFYSTGGDILPLSEITRENSYICIPVIFKDPRMDLGMELYADPDPNPKFGTQFTAIPPSTTLNIKYRTYTPY